MARLIDPDKLRAELTDRHLSTGRLVQWEAAMDAATVEVPETAHGYWIKDESTYAGSGVSNFKCSECGEFGGTWYNDIKRVQMYSYCPHCGAKMDGDPDCGKEACDL